MQKIFGFIVLSLFLFTACNQKTTAPLNRNLNDQQMRELADELAHKYIITDGHVDLPYRLKVQNFKLEKEYIGIPIETDKGDFDYKRAKKGGLDAPFMSIYIPARYQRDGGAKELADSLINMVEYIAAQNSGYFGVAKTPEDVRNLKKAGKIALPMGMENGAPVENDLSLIPQVIKVSNFTIKVIKFNLLWAFIYNIAGVLLAVTGIVTPLLAAFAMVLSSLSVVGNSLRIRRMSLHE